MKNYFPENFISRVLLPTFVCTFVLSATVTAQTAGTLDPSFGTGGSVFTTVATSDGNLFPRKAVMQSDGKAVGLFDSHLNVVDNGYTTVVIRYDRDGSLDQTFAAGGFLLTFWNTPSGAYGSAYAIALQTVDGDEKIVIAGSYGSSGVLRVDRYNSNGTPDLSFGSGGTAVHNTGGYALAVTTQPDGKITTADDVGVLTRLNADGTLDATFGTAGSVKLNGVRGYGLAVQPNGKILLCGISTVKGKGVMTVFRFNANGTADSGGSGDSTPGDSFGSAGRTTIEFFSGGATGNYSMNDFLVLDALGRIIVSATATPKGSSNGFYALARLTSNGQFDATFDRDGKATFDLTPLADSPRSLALQSDGRIVVSGVAANQQPNQNLGIIRVNPNGSLDTSFGTSGVVVSDYSPTAEWSYQGRIQTDQLTGIEKLVVVGTAQLGGVDYAVAARYLLF